MYLDNKVFLKRYAGPLVSLIAQIQDDYKRIIVADDSREIKSMIYALPFWLPISN